MLKILIAVALSLVMTDLEAHAAELYRLPDGTHRVLPSGAEPLGISVPDEVAQKYGGHVLQAIETRQPVVLETENMYEPLPFPLGLLYGLKKRYATSSLVYDEEAKRVMILEERTLIDEDVTLNPKVILAMAIVFMGISSWAFFLATKKKSKHNRSVAAFFAFIAALTGVAGGVLVIPVAGIIGLFAIALVTVPSVAAFAAGMHANNSRPKLYWTTSGVFYLCTIALFAVA